MIFHEDSLDIEKAMRNCPLARKVATRILHIQREANQASYYLTRLEH